MHGILHTGFAPICRTPLAFQQTTPLLCVPHLSCSHCHPACPLSSARPRTNHIVAPASEYQRYSFVSTALPLPRRAPPQRPWPFHRCPRTRTSTPLFISRCFLPINWMFIARIEAVSVSNNQATGGWAWHAQGCGAGGGGRVPPARAPSGRLPHAVPPGGARAVQRCSDRCIHVVHNHLACLRGRTGGSGCQYMP